MLAFQRSGDSALLEPVFAPDVAFRMADRVERRGRAVLAAGLARDFEDGVTARPLRVIPGEHIAITELCSRARPSSRCTARPPSPRSTSTTPAAPTGSSRTTRHADSAPTTRPGGRVACRVTRLYARANGESGSRGVGEDAALSHEVQLHAGDVGEADRQARGPPGRPLSRTSSRSVGSSTGSGTPSANTMPTRFGRLPTTRPWLGSRWRSLPAARSSNETTALLTVDETMDALRKAQQVGYRAPAA